VNRVVALLMSATLVMVAVGFTGAPACQANGLKSPSEYLGKQIGADGVLADYGEIWRYYTYLDSASDWIKVLDLGQTTLGKRFLMAVATDPANMASLDRYRAIATILRDARGVSPDQAAALADEGKVILLDMSAIHSDEVASTQMAIDLGYRIASGDPAICPYLKDVILLIVPSTNPDGHDMTVSWYEQWKGTEYDGGWFPHLYHPYAGHDNNRDWYMFNLVETRMVSEVMYRTWIPQVAIDHHQMWKTGARLFVPPYADPVNSNLDPLLWREIALVGSDMQLKLQENGCRGVIHGASFTGWWEGAASMTPLWHNIVSLLTEAAECRVASPVYVDPNELGAWGTGFPKYTRLSNFPDPWPGGWWRLSDIMDYDRLALVGALEACSRNKQSILMNFYRMAAGSIEKGTTEKPYAFVFPPSADDFSLRRMVERLILGGAEVHQATADFVADGRTFPAESYIVFLAQPYRPYVKDMLERQHFPEIRIAPEAPPLEPYDATAWTMPLKMGVEAFEVEQPFDAAARRVQAVEKPPSSVPRAPSEQVDYLALPRTSLGAYAFVNKALKAGLDVYTATAAGGNDVAPGTFLVKIGGDYDATASKVRELADGLGLAFTGVATGEAPSRHPLAPVRIGVYAPHLENEALGWLKYVLEDFGFEYRVLRNDDIKKGHLGKNLDVLVVHDVNPGIIKDGKPTGWGEEFFEPLPPDYSGGIGDDGVKALKTFVEEGGALIATAASCDFALSTFELPANDILKDVKDRDFSCPGAILALNMSPASELGWGLPSTVPCLFFYSRAFATRVPFGKVGRQVAATYAESDLVLSGWIHGREMIEGKPAVVDFTYGKGRVLLTGFDPVHRAQTYSTYRILFNALLR
jgi:hypothetical protein